jgi:hypothetical protein
MTEVLQLENRKYDDEKFSHRILILLHKIKKKQHRIS